MKILPHRRVTIETVLPVEEVVRRLTDVLNPPPSKFGEEPELIGWIVDDAFEIRRPTTFWYYNRVAVTRGRIVPGRVGANLDVTQTMNTLSRVMMSVCLVPPAAFFVGVAIALLLGSEFGRQAWGVGLGVLLGLYLVWQLLFAWHAGDVTDRLHRVLGTRGGAT